MYAVVSLPAGVFQPYSGVKTSILFMDRDFAKRSDSILFVEVENDGFDLGAQRNPIEKNDLPKALNIITKFRNESKFENVSDHFAFSVKKDRIKNESDFGLSGSRYKDNGNIKKGKWPLIPLGDQDVFRIESGGTPNTSKPEYWGGDIHWVTLVDLPAENLITVIDKTERTITKLGLDNSSAKLIPQNSVLISSRATIGRIAINKIELATNQGFKNIIIQDYSKISPNYLAYMLTSLVDRMKELGTGGTYKEISKSNLATLEIPLPPLEIQQEIVKELDGYQKIIAGARMVVENWKPHIEIDPNWEQVELGSVCEFMTGGTPSSSEKKYYHNGTIKWLVSGDIHKGEIYDCEGRITEIGLKNSNAKILPINSVLIALNGQGKTRGTVAMLRTEAACNQSIVSINPLEKNIVLSEFIYYQLKQMYSYLRNITGDKQRSGLSINILKRLKIYIPSIDEQKSIVEKIESEKKMVMQNEELIKIFDTKLFHRISKIWVEE